MSESSGMSRFVSLHLLFGAAEVRARYLRGIVTE